MSKEKAVDYFDRHPSSTECHITSDGRVFHTIGPAQGFASGLKDDKVESFTRAQFEVAEIPVFGSEEVPGDDAEKETRFKARVATLLALGFVRNEDLFENAENGGAISADDVYEISDEAFEISITPVINSSADDAKTQAIDALRNFDASTAKYPEIKALAKALGLETPTQKEPDLLAALKAAKANLEPQA